MLTPVLMIVSIIFLYIIDVMSRFLFDKIFGAFYAITTITFTAFVIDTMLNILNFFVDGK